MNELTQLTSLKTKWNWDKIVNPLVSFKVNTVKYSYGLEGDHGYTFRVGTISQKDRIGQSKLLFGNDDGIVFLHPFESIIAVSYEIFDIPTNAIGFIFPKSSFIRQGVIVSTAVVDAGFKGKLSFPMFNSSAAQVPLHLQEGVAQLVLIERDTDHQYSGKYQE